MKKIALTLIIVFMGVMFMSTLAFAKAERKEVDICCYSVGSIQYIWSAQHAKLINKYSKKIKATAAFCGAEAATVKLLAQDKTDFGELNALELEFAKRGEFFYQRFGEKSKAMFYDKIAQIWHQPYGSMMFFVLEKSSMQTLADVRGRKASLSSAACTIGPICEMILEVHGLKAGKDYTKVHLSCGAGHAPSALADRTVDMFECNNPGRQPSVENLHIRNKVRRIPFAPGKLDEFFAFMDNKYGQGRHGLYKITVEKGRYGKNDMTPMDTDYVAYDLIMATRRDKPEWIVYEYVKALFDNLDEFYEIGAYSKEITLEKAVQHLHAEIPLHPGAARYYYEKGVLPKAFYKDLPDDIKAKIGYKE